MSHTLKFPAMQKPCRTTSVVAHLKMSFMCSEIIINKQKLGFL